MNNFFGKLVTLLWIVGNGLALAQNAATATLADRIQSALNAVPGYGVFDYLTFKSESGKVTLLGRVSNADLKSQAEKAVRGLPGVTALEDEIVVTPLSKDDMAVGEAVSKTVYGGAVPSIYAKDHSIHILVKNGDVTLEGTVKSDIDRVMIGSAAVGAGNVYGVKNHLIATSSDSDDAQWRQDLAGGALSPQSVDIPYSPNMDN